MNFICWLEYQEDISPYPYEVDILQTLSKANLLQKAKIDVFLHKNAINKSYFNKNWSNSLKNDTYNKQTLIDILSGKINNPKIIDDTILGLKGARNVHQEYLNKAPSEQTGSHFWHSTWVRIYDDWIRYLLQQRL